MNNLGNWNTVSLPIMSWPSFDGVPHWLNSGAGLDPWLSMYLQIDYGLGTPPAIISRDLRDLKPDSSKD